MASRKPKPRTRKPTRRGSKPQKLAPLGVAPYRTPGDVRELRARAAADLRTISNYGSYLVMQDRLLPDASYVTKEQVWVREGIRPD